MIFDDRAGRLTKVNLTNGAVASITPAVPRRDAPSGDGFIQVTPETGSVSPRRLLLIPFGTDGANKTFTMRVFGLRATPPGTTNLLRGMWIPFDICSFLCTLGAAPGLQSCYVDENQFFADTIAGSTEDIGQPAVDYNIRSCADDGVASVDVAIYGASIIGVQFGIGSGQATGANALYAVL